MQVEIKWCFRLQWSFSSHHSASWDVHSCGGCEQIPVVLGCGTPGLVVLWEWGEGRTQPFLSSCLAVSSTPSLKSICSYRLHWDLSSRLRSCIFCLGKLLWLNLHTPYNVKRGFKPSQSALDKKESQLQGQLNLSCWYRLICSRGCTIKTPSVKYHLGSDVIIPETVWTSP